jgi:hypothetical protein
MTCARNRHPSCFHFDSTPQSDGLTTHGLFLTAELILAALWRWSTLSPSLTPTTASRLFIEDDKRKEPPPFAFAFRHDATREYHGPMRGVSDRQPINSITIVFLKGGREQGWKPSLSTLRLDSILISRDPHFSLLGLFDSGGNAQGTDTLRALRFMSAPKPAADRAFMAAWRHLIHQPSVATPLAMLLPGSSAPPLCYSYAAGTNQTTSCHTNR